MDIHEKIPEEDVICDSSYDTRFFPSARHHLCSDFPLETLMEKAQKLTAEHFHHGTQRQICLFAPLYLGNICVNRCKYCGFQNGNPISRRHLTHEEAMREVDILQRYGFHHILLVAGENPKLCTPEYFSDIIREITARGMESKIEIAPQTKDGYSKIANAGCKSLTMFQETYDAQLYGNYHPSGPKANFLWRLGTFSRAAEAGINVLGLGFLLGLADPVDELLRMMRHARWLTDYYPGTSLTFSLPRIRVAPHGFQPPFPVNDDLFIRMYCTLRLAFPDAHLVLSTRENPELRNLLVKTCITLMSAGSQTAPGGYYEEEQARKSGIAHFSGEQFPITDSRSWDDIMKWLSQHHFYVEG